MFRKTVGVIIVLAILAFGVAFAAGAIKAPVGGPSDSTDEGGGSGKDWEGAFDLGFGINLSTDERHQWVIDDAKAEEIKALIGASVEKAEIENRDLEAVLAETYTKRVEAGKQLALTESQMELVKLKLSQIGADRKENEELEAIRRRQGATNFIFALLVVGGLLALSLSRSLGSFVKARARLTPIEMTLARLTSHRTESPSQWHDVTDNSIFDALRALLEKRQIGPSHAYRDIQGVQVTPALEPGEPGSVSQASDRAVVGAAAANALAKAGSPAAAQEQLHSISETVSGFLGDVSEQVTAGVARGRRRIAEGKPAGEEPGPGEEISKGEKK